MIKHSDRQKTKILAIETSCDETAAAVILVGDNPKILSNIVSSQVNLHALTGGVVPEVASRAHVEAIIPVIAEALVSAKYSKHEKQNSNKSAKNEFVSEFDTLISDLYSEAQNELKNISYIGYTAGPGLIGSLLVGYNAAKTLAYTFGLPIIPINHIEGHIYSAFAEEIPNNNNQLTIDNKQISFPLLALTVSGGHTSLTLMRDHGEYENIGKTLDDAAGEAFDKVAKLLDLGYPGGPEVSKLASQFRKLQVTSKKLKDINPKHPTPNTQPIFPRPIMNDGTFNFSFSGLKTAVLQAVLNIKKTRNLTMLDKKVISTAFEDAVVDVLTTKTLRAVQKHKVKAVALAGGVAANQRLRKILKSKIDDLRGGIKLYIPPLSLCGDNAGMIGLAANYHINKNNVTTWEKSQVDSNLELA